MTWADHQTNVEQIKTAWSEFSAKVRSRHGRGGKLVLLEQFFDDIFPLPDDVSFGYGDVSRFYSSGTISVQEDAGEDAIEHSVSLAAKGMGWDLTWTISSSDSSEIFKIDDNDPDRVNLFYTALGLYPRSWLLRETATQLRRVKAALVVPLDVIPLSSPEFAAALKIPER